jgi:maleate cis-trans isomerase
LILKVAGLKEQSSLGRTEIKEIYEIAKEWRNTRMDEIFK